MTSADHVLDLIRSNPDVSNIFESAFDFDISAVITGRTSACPRALR
ncbi:hypothetical protein ACWD64_37945 [Streptomyces antibioticus]